LGQKKEQLILEYFLAPTSPQELVLIERLQQKIPATVCNLHGENQIFTGKFLSNPLMLSNFEDYFGFDSSPNSSEPLSLARLLIVLLIFAVFKLLLS
jgi:hypothetical protein